MRKVKPGSLKCSNCDHTIKLRPGSVGRINTCSKCGAIKCDGCYPASVCSNCGARDSNKMEYVDVVAD